MHKTLAAILILAPGTATAQVVQPGSWDVTSTVVELSMPGMPGFIQRMARGRSKAEHKRLSAGQTVEALLAPDPKAACRIDSQHVADGRYAQVLACPQKKGPPMRITRTGTYTATGFVGQAIVSGTTTRGPMRVTLDQRAARVGG